MDRMYLNNKIIQQGSVIWSKSLINRDFKIAWLIAQWYDLQAVSTSACRRINGYDLKDCFSMCVERHHGVDCRPTDSALNASKTEILWLGSVIQAAEARTGSKSQASIAQSITAAFLWSGWGQTCLGVKWYDSEAWLSPKARFESCSKTCYLKHKIRQLRSMIGNLSRLILWSKSNAGQITHHLQAGLFVMEFAWLARRRIFLIDNSTACLRLCFHVSILKLVSVPLSAISDFDAWSSCDWLAHSDRLNRIQDVSPCLLVSLPLYFTAPSCILSQSMHSRMNWSNRTSYTSSLQLLPGMLLCQHAGRWQ